MKPTISIALLLASIASFSAAQSPRPVPDTVLPTGATDSNPLRVFLMAGQSGCVGQSTVQELIDDPNPNYDELKGGAQDGVWFAGLHAGAKYQADYVGGDDGSRFFLGPLIVGQESRNLGFFGPDASMGRRLADADPNSAPVLIIKYCWGGTNVERQWNPDSVDNIWDRAADDGTAAWLMENGADLYSKKHLYVNFIYTIRRSLELLEGVVPYELSGFYFMQGAADKNREWKDYGDDLVALFETTRSDLDAPNLSIVDTGAGGNNAPRTAKEYASSVVGNSVVAPFVVNVQNPDADCVGMVGDECIGINWPNWDVFNFYGYDPLVPDADKPEGASDKIFHWFKVYPTNNHMEYEADILKGRSLANSYIQAFTDFELTEEWIADDLQIRFPIPVCDPAVNDGRPTETDLCWMDLRGGTEFQPSMSPSERSKSSKNAKKKGKKGKNVRVRKN